MKPARFILDAATIIAAAYVLTIAGAFFGRMLTR
jgi:hypothetical protein